MTAAEPPPDLSTRETFGLTSMTGEERLGRKGLFVGTIALLAVICIIGWFDFETGASIRFSLFYLIPILVAAWWLGKWPALIVALGAGLVGFIAETGWRRSPEIPESEWNVYTRLVVFLALAFLAARIRRDQIDLARLLETTKNMARTDPLTGLANSRWFHQVLRSGVEGARREGLAVGVMFMDADGFKNVNDLHGHEKGDLVLRGFSRVISGCIREEDLAARLGGDEFAAVLVDIDRAAAERIAERILLRVKESFDFQTDLPLGLSIGVAYAALAPDDPRSLLRAADLAMYEAKSLGKGRIVHRDWTGKDENPA